MSIKSIKMYTVICDSCGKDAFEGQDTIAWDSPGSASDMAIDVVEYICRKDKHYCPSCTKWNEDETEIIPKVIRK